MTDKSSALPPAAPTTASRHLEHVAIDVAKLAAKLVLDGLGSAATASTKSTSTDVVTHTDLLSEQLIRDELADRCPGSTIVGEEFDDELGANSIGWIVDPIDGTVNFLYDLPVVAVSIAATIGDTVVAGAVTDVLRGETFSAARGEGARRDGEPILCASIANLSQALVGTGFAYDAASRSDEAQVLNGVLPACRDIRCMGSAALNLCWVACGRLDGFYERSLKSYDYAAGALIAAEAGATVEVPSMNPSDLMITTSPSIFSELRRLVHYA